MNGKYENKNNKKTVRRRRKQNKTVLAAVIILVAALCLCMVLILSQKAGNEVKPGTAGESTINSAALETEATEVNRSYELGQGIVLSEIAGYNGVYMEDGTNEIVGGILSVVVTNENEAALQYAEISLETDAGMAYFSVSTLKPGESAVLLEKNRMEYRNTSNYENMKLDLAAFFDEMPGLREDVLKVQTIENVMNITNISEKDISGNIVVYYKNWSDGLYYGGITYRVTIEGGLSAGEIRQITPNHFDAVLSRVVMATCEE